VAHEIKNPLGSIRLGVSMLRDTTDDPDSINTIDLVERGINHLNKLVVDVTQFSRDKPLMLTPVNLSRLLDSSLELVGDKLAEKHTPVKKRYATDEIVSDWDEDQLRQVFMNVLGNAVDASKEGSPLEILTTTLDVSQQYGAGSNGKSAIAPNLTKAARIQIIDRGTGMDDATRVRVFEPFFTTKRRGTGLGLAVVKKIVEQHGGSIRVESEPQKGTTFIIDLPLQRGAAVRAQPVTNAFA
jgi:signal transduction histidine kinase